MIIWIELEMDETISEQLLGQLVDRQPIDNLNSIYSYAAPQSFRFYSKNELVGKKRGIKNKNNWTKENNKKKKQFEKMKLISIRYVPK